MTDIASIKEDLAATDTTKIFFTDLNGRLMALPINPDHIESIIENGIGFDGSSVAGYASVEQSDRVLIPDPESFRMIEFKGERLGFFIGHVFNEHGQRAAADPRAVLERVVAEAEAEFGFRFLLGPEHEFFLLRGDEFNDDLHTDKAGYFLTTPHDKGGAVRNRIIEILSACDIAFEKAHHEVTPSQHEINLECIAPLAGADRTVMFNFVTQKAAEEFGYHATFMPKPFDGYNRSAFHIHLSMQDTAGKNQFYDAQADYHLSRLARSFIAGIVKYARETSLIMASTFNSYKAYVLEREAPIIRGWGIRNRSSMVRVPYATRPEATRIELRNPDPAGNMYLQMAVLIAMGLQGIRGNLDCGRPDTGSTYKKNYGQRIWDRRFLPKSMYEALVEAERSKFLAGILGPRIYANYLAIKTADWEEHRTHVTPREHAKYLSI